MGRIANCENTRSIPSGQPIQGNGQKLHVIPATDAFCRFGKVRIGVGDFVMEMGQALPPHAVSAAFGKYISALPIVVPIDLHENAPCLKNTHSLISDFWLFREAEPEDRSEEHTSELPSLMRISYAVFC